MKTGKQVQLAQESVPLLCFDNREPFLPVLVGYTVAFSRQASPSFKRELTPRPGGMIIEYAIYWDWEIGHHYDLEHLWVYRSAAGQIELVEGSAHGIYLSLWPAAPELEQVEYTIRNKDQAGRACLVEDNDPVFRQVQQAGPITVYAEPGKHAFAPCPDWFIARKEEVMSSCISRAGQGGLSRGVFGDRLQAGEQDRDVLAQKYLKEYSFIPSFQFGLSIWPGRDLPLLPWEELYKIIPKRVDCWMAALAKGQRQPDNLPNSS